MARAKIRWADTLDEEEYGEAALPPTTTKGPDSHGVKTVTEYYRNEKGDSFRRVTKSKVLQVEKKVYKVRARARARPLQFARLPLRPPGSLGIAHDRCHCCLLCGRCVRVARGRGAAGGAPPPARATGCCSESLLQSEALGAGHGNQHSLGARSPGRDRPEPSLARRDSGRQAAAAVAPPHATRPVRARAPPKVTEERRNWTRFGKAATETVQDSVTVQQKEDIPFERVRQAKQTQQEKKFTDMQTAMASADKSTIVGSLKDMLYKRRMERELLRAKGLLADAERPPDEDGAPGKPAGLPSAPKPGSYVPPRWGGGRVWVLRVYRGCWEGAP
jgi:hypothetical protein